MRALTEEFMRAYFNKEGYDLLEWQKGVMSHQKIKHRECGYVYPATFHDFKYDDCRCPQCVGQITITEEFMRDFFHKNGYDLLEWKKGNMSHQKVKHRECGYIYPVSFHGFKDGNSRCPNCAGNARLTKEFLEDLTRKILRPRLGTVWTTTIVIFEI